MTKMEKAVIEKWTAMPIISMPTMPQTPIQIPTVNHKKASVTSVMNLEGAQIYF